MKSSFSLLNKLILQIINLNRLDGINYHLNVIYFSIFRKLSTVLILINVIFWVAKIYDLSNSAVIKTEKYSKQNISIVNLSKKSNILKKWIGINNSNCNSNLIKRASKLINKEIKQNYTEIKLIANIKIKRKCSPRWIQNFRFYYAIRIFCVYIPQ